MKKTIFIFSTLILACGITACASKETATPSVKTEKKTEINVPLEEDDVVFIDEQEDDAEYLRSIDQLSGEDVVTKAEFEEDKQEILRIIAELSKIMEKGDAKAWYAYISPESQTYWTNPVNIRKAQKKLPDKTIQLHGISDYFRYVFVPSRRRSNVDEIRYISRTNIKAVELKDDLSTVVYYQFVKIDGNWLVELPKI